jgi:hypothetical protein
LAMEQTYCKLKIVDFKLQIDDAPRCRPRARVWQGKTLRRR